MQGLVGEITDPNDPNIMPEQLVSICEYYTTYAIEYCYLKLDRGWSLILLLLYLPVSASNCDEFDVSQIYTI